MDKFMFDIGVEDTGLGPSVFVRLDKARYNPDTQKYERERELTPEEFANLFPDKKITVIEEQDRTTRTVTYSLVKDQLTSQVLAYKGMDKTLFFAEETEEMLKAIESLKQQFLIEQESPTQ